MWTICILNAQRWGFKNIFICWLDLCTNLNGNQSWANKHEHFTFSKNCPLSFGLNSYNLYQLRFKKIGLNHHFYSLTNHFTVFNCSQLQLFERLWSCADMLAVHEDKAQKTLWQSWWHPTAFYHFHVVIFLTSIQQILKVWLWNKVQIKFFMQ